MKRGVGQAGAIRLGLAVGLLCSLATAGVPVMVAHSIERLGNGNTLIADGGSVSSPNGRTLEVDSLGRLVWAYLKCDVPFLHSARRLGNGNTLMTASNGDLVLEVNAAGDSVWAMSAGLDYPNEAFRLASGNTLITDRNNDRVVEVTPGLSVVWSYSNLLHPHNGSRLESGNTLVCDSDRNRIVEVDSTGAVVWSYGVGMNWPRSAQRLANGNTLIGDSRNDRTFEVDAMGTIVWQCTTNVRMPYMAVRLPSGNTLTSSALQVVELTPSGGIAWRYPRTRPVLVETLWVVNPSSGCSLYVHIHRPAWADAGRKVPGVVYVPGGNGFGSSLDQNGTADNYASDGFAFLHFDPDGRGRSGAFPENYNGFVQQDGMHACLELLAQKPYVDTAHVGIFSQSYGITMASGMIARYPEPRVGFLLDFEGPADRNQTCQDSGGHVPVPPDSESFWLEREAGRFAKQVPCPYLRFQTAVDHNPRILDNRHCVALIDSATSVVHGGSGVSEWTRVNDSVMNEANRVYTVTDPPQWVPELQESQNLARQILYLHELAGRTPQVGAEEMKNEELRTGKPGLSIVRGVLRIPVSSFFIHHSLFDHAGRVVMSLQPGVNDIRHLPTGIYFVRSRDASAVERVVVTR